LVARVEKLQYAHLLPRSGAEEEEDRIAWNLKGAEGRIRATRTKNKDPRGRIDNIPRGSKIMSGVGD